MNQIFSTALALFVLMDAIGNIPLFLVLTKNLPEKRKGPLIGREMLIALGVLVTFQFIGDLLLKTLEVELSTVSISGGIILIIMALRMIFPPQQIEEEAPQDEPFIVPIAIPLIAGPAALTFILVYSKKLNTLDMLISILIAWFFSTLILLLAPKIAKRIGKRGTIALERLMGLILTLLATQMFLNGVETFSKK